MPVPNRLNWFAVWKWPADPSGRRRIWRFGLPLLFIMLLSAYFSAYLLTVRRAGVGFRYDSASGQVIGTPTPGYSLRRFGFPRLGGTWLWRAFKPAHAIDRWLRPDLWDEQSHTPSPQEKELFLSHDR